MTDLQKWQFEQEVKLRGGYLTVSADLEDLLLRIMIVSIVDANPPVLRDFTKMTLGNKIRFAELDLKRYSPNIYIKCKKEFKELKALNKIRGKVAHCQILWEDKDVSFLYIQDLEIINKQWKVTKTKYTIDFLNIRMMEYRRLIIKIMNICIEVVGNFEKKYPDWKSSLNN